MPLQILLPQTTTSISLPVYGTAVSAGFPSPADDFIERKLDLNEYLIKHPAATFFVRVNGESMKKAGIGSGDILVVDRSLDPKDGAIVIAAIDGEFTVKRVQRQKGELFLIPENTDYQPIKIEETDQLEIFGVVTSVIKKII